MHNIMANTQFLSLRVPAWHGLGQVINEEITALAASQKLTIPEIHTEPVVTTSGIQTSYKAILGTTQDMQEVYAVVRNNYHEISHKDFLQAWDNALPVSVVETMGLLGMGETLFMTTKLPSFSVKGDELDTYLLAYNPLTGREATTVRITPVRVVCQNTLLMSGSQYVEQHRVLHNQPAALQIERFLREAFSKTQDKVETVKEAYQFLASLTMTDSQVQDSLKGLYPDVPQPKDLLGRALTDPSHLQ